MKVGKEGAGDSQTGLCCSYLLTVARCCHLFLSTRESSCLTPM